jgi:uncharacterized protein YdaU (DUF1376 family)
VGSRLNNSDSRARFPYLPLFVDDWLSSDAVETMTLEQQGAYLRLLLRQWKAPNGLLPKEDATLARWSGLGARWRRVGRPVLDRCFSERADGFVNLKLRRLWEETRERSGKAREAAAERWRRAKSS